MFDLPEPRPFHVERPPLATAIVQVRFPLLAKLQSLSGIVAFQERVAEVLPYAERVELQQIVVQMSGVGSPQTPSAEASVAWKFTNDEEWTLSLEAGAATFAIGAGYTTGESFAGAWRTIVEALQSPAVGVARYTRLGVRYIDIVNLMAVERPVWKTWFQPEIIGLLSSDIFREGVSVRTHISQQHVIYEDHAQLPLQALIRYGVVPAETNVPTQPAAPPMTLDSESFLLDVDLFVEGPQPFISDKLMAQYWQLHQQQEQFFLWALTGEGYEHFGVTHEYDT
jgi:uncharacterized protein (TIGR04255 family)